MLKQFRSVPQSEHQEYAYVENIHGVFARFYGPDANKNMETFVNAYVYGAIKPDHYYCTTCGSDLGNDYRDHKCSGGANV